MANFDAFRWNISLSAKPLISEECFAALMQSSKEICSTVSLIWLEEKLFLKTYAYNFSPLLVSTIKNQLTSLIVWGTNIRIVSLHWKKYGTMPRRTWILKSSVIFIIIDCTKYFQILNKGLLDEASILFSNADFESIFTGLQFGGMQCSIY